MVPHRIELPLFPCRVTPLRASEFLEWVSSATTKDGMHLVCNHNLHSIYLHLKNPAFAELYALADVILIDGFPVLKLASQATSMKLTSAHRIGSLDWLYRLSSVQNIDRLAVVGGSLESNRGAVEVLQSTTSFPRVQGWPGNDWSYCKSAEVVEQLQAFRPNMVIVGLGMPLQEEFLLSWWKQLPPSIYATVGGAIDQISGVQRPAPRWIGRFGIEWLWRLVSQPRRLAGRYLIEPWGLLYWVLKRKMT